MVTDHDIKKIQRWPLAGILADMLETILFSQDKT